MILKKLRMLLNKKFLDLLFFFINKFNLNFIYSKSWITIMFLMKEFLLKDL